MAVELHIFPAPNNCWTGRVFIDRVAVEEIGLSGSAEDVKKKTKRKIDHVLYQPEPDQLLSVGNLEDFRKDLTLATNMTAALLDGSDLTLAARARVLSALYDALGNRNASETIPQLLNDLALGKIPGIQTQQSQ